MVNLTICLSGLIETHQQIVISALNIPLSLTTFLANLVIIIALQKPSSLHPPSNLLLGCLASTDLCVGLIMQPLYVVYLMSSEDYRLCYYVQRIFIATATIFAGFSAITLTAISVDRLLALMLGLRYRQVVTLRRVWALVAFIWLNNISISATLIFNGDIFLKVLTIEGMLCVIISSFCYSKIYFMLRQHQVQVQDHVQQGQLTGVGTGINLARYKKTVASALWVQTIYLLSYLPFCLTIAVVVITGLVTPSLYVAVFATLCLVSLNSSLNPFLYCWKMRELRQAVKDTIRGIWCPG